MHKCVLYISVCIYHHLNGSTLLLKYLYIAFSTCFWSALCAFFTAILTYS